MAGADLILLTVCKTSFYALEANIALDEMRRRFEVKIWLNKNEMRLHFDHLKRAFRNKELAVASEDVSVAVLSAWCRAVQWCFRVWCSRRSWSREPMLGCVCVLPVVCNELSGVPLVKQERVHSVCQSRASCFQSCLLRRTYDIRVASWSTQPSASPRVRDAATVRTTVRDRQEWPLLCARS